jgi:hypothetical protein
VLQKNKDKYIGISQVYDYIYRPPIYDNRTLYEWIQMAERVKKKLVKDKNGDLDDLDELDLIEPSMLQDSKGFNTKTTAFSLKKNSPVEYDELNIDSDNEDIDNEDNIYSLTDSDSESIKQDSNNEVEDSSQFLKEHPLYETHTVNFNSKRKNIVPNFIGGSLPRRDYGDREYYCATMLTLFKPWRNGKDLKEDNYSWDETFVTYQFTSHQLKLMDNFNIRYECNDARDDYSAQLKKGAVLDNILPYWMSSNEIIDSNQRNQGDDFGDEEGIDDINYGINKYSSLGPHGKIIKLQMHAAEDSVKDAGWLDDTPNGIDKVNTIPFIPGLVQPGSKWKEAIQIKKQKILADRYANIPNKNHYNNQSKDSNRNNIKVIDQSYLLHDFQAKSKSAQNLIDESVIKFTLNIEQQRAFRIIANHAVTPQCEQLKMNLGGMGGTGKSQVIKALKHFFEQRNESYRIVLLGPTGASAALLSGSTYHSFLGICVGNGGRNIAQVKAKLEGVDYIFIDEVSMLSCHDLYKINAQLTKALNVHDLPFGGINMILAGDFAQLPPVGGAPLYSGMVGTQVDSGVKPLYQEAAIGKALWHQVTTVVILRENMRQKTQTTEDAALRTALVNMRYGACTPDDIKFLRSRIAGKRYNQPHVFSKEFRNVAIICGIHSQKDMINQLGCERFATETGQKLTTFYSIDKWGKEHDPATKKQWGKSKKASKLRHRSDEIDFDDQLEIWKVRHGDTEHFAGKLSLCVGMPVMIRNNDATELCITKGQEGIVVGWQSYKGSHGKCVLDTLFIKLENPPQLVQIPGLPDNIVPIMKSTKTITCVFPSDLKESIERQQVWVLPNFAMTAHTAQGKTRPYNVVHLNSCLSHMAYYTALSRSATAAGTIIIQGFDSKVITKGCSGYLRQELRELEILDEITRLKYEGQFPDYINSHLRYTLIHQFQQWKGIFYIPAKTDPALRWSAKDPFTVIDKIYKQKTDLSNKSLTALCKKRKLSIANQNHLENPSIKRQKICSNQNDCHSNKPKGLLWDLDNWSCAYDSLFVIFYDIWIQDPKRWTNRFKSLCNEYLNLLVDNFNLVSEGKVKIEDARDSIRFQLHRKDSVRFPVGPVGTSVGSLAEEIVKTNHAVASSQLICSKCDYEDSEVDDSLDYMLNGNSSISGSTFNWLKSLQIQKTQDRCPECFSEMRKNVYYDNIPHFMIMEYPDLNIKTSHKLTFKTEESHVTLYLRGIVYYGGYHFTSRIFSCDGDISYHDGMTTGSHCIDDGHLNIISDDSLQHCKDRKLVLAIYAQE